MEVAIRSTLSRHRGTWLGWSGIIAAADAIGVRTIENGNLTCIVTDLSHEDYDEYYKGFANSVLWPILHYRLDLAEFSRRDLTGYLRVNERLANELHKVIGPDDLVWVHDYHLFPFARMLRQLGHKNRIGFFLHVPLPPPEILTAMPHYEYLIPALRDYDLVGFQTERDTANFARFLAQECGAPNHIPMGFGTPGRHMRLGTFPVGIDVMQFRAEAEASSNTPYVRDVVRSVGGSKGALIIGVDRLDYSKGISHRFEAYDHFLRDYPGWHHRATYLQVTPRSRSQIPDYAAMERELQGIAGRINGTFGDGAWTPIRYINRSHSRSELAGLYRAAAVGLVTPLRDGMNLVAKEYVAAQDPANPGVLILSKFAGAAAEMKSALLVNPYDPESVCQAIAKALEMPLEERQSRHESLMAQIVRHDITDWGDRFLSALAGRPLNSYMPPAPLPRPTVPTPMAEHRLDLKTTVMVREMLESGSA